MDAGDSDCVGEAVRLRFRDGVAEVEGDNEGVEDNSGSACSTCRDRNDREFSVLVAWIPDRVRFLMLSDKSSLLVALFLCKDGRGWLSCALLELLVLCDKSMALLKLLTLVRSDTFSFSEAVVTGAGGGGAGKGGAV